MDGLGSSIIVILGTLVILYVLWLVMKSFEE
jgi:hypothetical protein